MSGRLTRVDRERQGAEALRRYAALLAEHERVRRLLEEAQADPDARVAPSGAAWKPLRDVAFLHGMGPRAEALQGFCSEFVAPVGPRERRAAGAPAAEGTLKQELERGTPERGEEPPETVPMRAYGKALAAALEVVGDAVVKSGVEAPWGAGQPRAPRSEEAFEAICRRLRDGDEAGGGFGSLAVILDSVPLPPVSRVERLTTRVTYDLAHSLLKIGETRIFLPEGREREFLRVLVERRCWDKLTPPVEHDIVWVNAVNQLRKRIRAATGRNLLREVVLPATAPVGAYRLNPKVRVSRL